MIFFAMISFRGFGLAMCCDDVFAGSGFARHRVIAGHRDPLLAKADVCPQLPEADITPAKVGSRFAE